MLIYSGLSPFVLWLSAKLKLCGSSKAQGRRRYVKYAARVSQKATIELKQISVRPIISLNIDYLLLKLPNK